MLQASLSNFDDAYCMVDIFDDDSDAGILVQTLNVIYQLSIY